MRDGLFGTTAPFLVDLVLLLEFAMGVGLLTGAFFARAGRFHAHAWCQSVVVLLNAIVIALGMLPSYHLQVWPRIPVRLAHSYYAMATTHAALGAIVECAALYILLAAGTTLMPEKLRLTQYKLWMRTVLASWWIVILLGVATYARWYVPSLFRR